MFLRYIPAPISEITTRQTANAGVKLLIKREDQNHPFVSGNKWWKLKYNLEEAIRSNQNTLLTFGGAYSNHIYATAAAAHELGLKSIGVIRGEETKPLNHTLAFAESKGMKLQYVSREAYRQKSEEAFIQNFHDQFGDFYLIPEGGTNELAVKGCAEFAAQLNAEVDFDYLCLPVGTGGTMAGMILGSRPSVEVIGFSVLKGGDFLEAEVKKYWQKFPDRSNGNWRIETSYHYGGYGKSTAELHHFMAEMKSQYQLPLDQVYTAKMMTGVFDLMGKGYFNSGSTVMMVHTGGLQGS